MERNYRDDSDCLVTMELHPSSYTMLQYMRGNVGVQREPHLPSY